MRPQAGQYERYRDALKGERLPLAFVDVNAFDRNIAYVGSQVEGTGKTVRVHSKSLRSAPMIRRVLDKGGAHYRGVMTFTVEETALLAKHGLGDFIVAYPSVQASDLKLLAKLTKDGVKAALMIDCVEHLDLLDDAGKAAGAVLDACLELDVSYRPAKSSLHLGPRRSPVRSPDEALAVGRSSLKKKWVRITSVMGYEAHIAGPNDAVPGKFLQNRATALLKKLSVAEFTPRRGNVVETLREEGVPIEVVNGGGSGSLSTTSRDPSVTEVTAGSAFYAPALFWHYRDVSFEPSAFFAIQIVRRPKPDMVTCLGGGYVASGAAGADKLPVPVYPEGLKLIGLEGAGEVQTPLELPEGCPDLRLGDPVIFQHAKAGELCERFNELLLIDGDTIVDRVKTYRGEGKAFL